MVPENVHTPLTEGIENLGVGAFQKPNFQRGGRGWVLGKIPRTVGEVWIISDTATFN